MVAGFQDDIDSEDEAQPNLAPSHGVELSSDEDEKPHVIGSRATNGGPLSLSANHDSGLELSSSNSRAGSKTSQRRPSDVSDRTSSPADVTKTKKADVTVAPATYSDDSDLEPSNGLKVLVDEDISSDDEVKAASLAAASEKTANGQVRFEFQIGVESQFSQILRLNSGN